LAVDEAFGYLQRLNPALTREDVIAAHVARLRYAQPVCEPGFAAKIPPIQTPIQGLQIADTCFYYPEDRGISESVRLGREMAERLAGL
jgi:protoporphyrinogen oxidase